jgi:ketosteroid isomerase-like protein
MPRHNVETVKRIYELAAEDWVGGRRHRQRDRGPLRELFDPDIVLEENQDFPDSDTYRGYEALERWWRSFFDVFDQIGMEPRAFEAVDDRVLVQIHHRFRSKMGVELEQDLFHVWTLRDGRAVHVTGYNDRSAALRAVGMAEDAPA